MPRKKISPSPDNASAEIDLGNLGPDEELVERHTTERRLSKEKRQPHDDPEAKTTSTETIIDVDGNGDPIDPPDDDPIFEPGTLGALLTQGEDEQLRSQQCNVLVVRKPDTPGETFAKPNPSRLTLAPLRNIELTMPQSEIEETVRLLYFGGHYYLQIQMGQTWGPGWSCDLADPPDVHQRMRAQERGETLPVIDAVPVLPATPTPARPGDFLDDFIERSRKMRELKDAIFGDELKELTELRRRAAETEPQTKTAEVLLLEKALAADANPTLQTKLLDMAFPSDKKGDRSMASEIIDAIVENKDTILPIATGLIGALFGRGAANAPQPLAGVPPAQSVGTPVPQFVPPPIATPAPSRFQRPPAEPVDAAGNMNAGASAEIATTREEDEAMDTITPHPATQEPAADDR